MKAIFLDRDGTIIIEPPDEQVDALEKLELVPGVIQGLRLLRKYGYNLVMVSNQDNLGTDKYPYEKYELVQNKLLKLLEGEGIEFDKIFICPHSKDDNCSCRKPKTGLVNEYIRINSLDLSCSFVIGDRDTDIAFAKNIGCKAIKLSKQIAENADYSTSSFLDACNYIVRKNRSASIKRVTKETDISVEVSLDGTGEYEIQTGIEFFNHMLEQLAKHSGIDIKLKVHGDLKVDEHHSVEDTGIALGNAIREALGVKRGIARFGCVIPMDESLAQVAIDLSGRTYCSVKAKFKREKVGDFPTELVEDFFCAFAEGLKANMHIIVNGRNEHHKIEAIFKAVARALKQAIALTESDAIPSTKGIL